MNDAHTGPIRRVWNYFKRGKGELNFLLNVYQTLVIIWGVEAITKSNSRLILVTVVFGAALFLSSLVIGKYSLTKVDTALIGLNPFTQDMVIVRRDIARGLEFLADENNQAATAYFSKAQDLAEKWIVEIDEATY